MQTLKSIERALEATKAIIEIQQKSVLRDSLGHPMEIDMCLEDNEKMFINLLDLRQNLEWAISNLEKL